MNPLTLLASTLLLLGSIQAWAPGIPVARSASVPSLVEALTPPTVTGNLAARSARDTGIGLSIKRQSTVLRAKASQEDIPAVATKEDTSVATSPTGTTTTTNNKPTKASSSSSSSTEDLIHDFCVGTNNFWKQFVIPPFLDYVQVQKGGTAASDPLSKLTAPPEVPGIARPVWLVILGSVPTALGWYGYYKFSVEEELFQYELQEGNGKVTGCGGYGTLLPFVFGILLGFPLSALGVPGGGTLVEAAGIWILLGQVNLYRRVNELCSEASEEMGFEDSQQQGPLWEWWALLPPPLDVVVGLRQVHFLSEYWRIQRGEPYDKDVIAEELFPFISEKKRFTLKEFFRTPSMWFWFTKEWKDFDYEFLQDSPSNKQTSS